MLDAMVTHIGGTYVLYAEEIFRNYPMPVISGYFVCFQHNVLQCHNRFFVKI